MAWVVYNDVQSSFHVEDSRGWKILKQISNEEHKKIKAIFSTEIQVTIPLRSSSEVYTPKDCACVDCCKHVGLKNDNCRQLQLDGRITLY